MCQRLWGRDTTRYLTAAMRPVKAEQAYKIAVEVMKVQEMLHVIY